MMSVAAPWIERGAPSSALYTPRALEGLAAFDPTAPATDIIESLGVREVEVADRFGIPEHQPARRT